MFASTRGTQRHAGLVQRVADPVRQDRLDAAVAQQHLDPSDAVRRGVALLRGGQVVAQLARHAGECPRADHGAKKGVLT